MGADRQDATVIVRAAELGDLDELIELRLENGRVHAALDPSVYRVPDRAAVRSHYVAELTADHDGRALLVAVVEQLVVGLAEVSIDPPSPAHAILLPVPAGRLHLMVARDRRGQGVGRRLERAAREWASLHGVRQLVAGIHVDNHNALEFYERRGYRDNAMIRIVTWTTCPGNDPLRNRTLGGGNYGGRVADETRMRPIGWWLKEADARLDNAFDQALRGSGVDRRGWQVLSSLSRGPVSQEELLTSLGSFAPAPVLTETVSDFKDRGWVEEHAGLLRLTVQGTNQQEALAPVVAGVRRQVSAALPQADYVTLVQLLARLTEGLAR